MGVNIWVTAPHDGQKILLAWGEHLHAAVDVDGDNIITNFSESTVLTVRETPAEIAALIAAEERKRDRREIASGIFAAIVATRTIAPEHFSDRSDYAVTTADALLAALDATEGAA